MSHSSRYCSVILFEAQRLVAAGLSVIPILPDGSKKPAVAWKPYQTRLPTKAELVQWFHDETRGMAAIGGAVSGCLEILDFDAQELVDPWSIMVETLVPAFSCVYHSVRRHPKGAMCSIVAKASRAIRNSPNGMVLTAHRRPSSKPAVRVDMPSCPLLIRLPPRKASLRPPAW